MEGNLLEGCSVEASGEFRGGCDEVELSITSEEEKRKERRRRELIAGGGEGEVIEERRDRGIRRGFFTATNTSSSAAQTHQRVTHMALQVGEVVFHLIMILI